MATIKDVARVSGVSIATVSRVLNEYPHVKPDMRAKVKRAITELNYAPNRLASSFRTQQSRVVGVFLRQQRTPFSSAVAYAIEDTLFRAGYRVLICSTNGDADREETYVRSMLELRTEGVIIRPSGSRASTLRNVSMLRDAGIAVVFTDMWHKVPGVSGVVCDNFAGGHEGMRHLIEQGHRHIGVIAGQGAQLQKRIAIGNVGSERVRGILKASQDLASDVTLRFSHPFTGESNLDVGRSETHALLDRHAGITAIFATTDMLAVGAMQAAHQRGIDVPGSLSVLGYDGIMESGITYPALSTVRQPIHEMGQRAAQALLAHMKYPETAVQYIVLENTILARGSTAPLF
ncbi:LacI family DNA-binding transcriptional regulator [Pelagibacterium lentulum]|uniref:LacI family transcriptional regulator n=1 Tax=Pelagibacterium lentulum TaxID=2029865 RepID=A0A916R7U8_9HYPH|nr:LacI family DNA-binding transcriptional regulator [Pelagibacterium lentulum]GGA40485.1 LacI family transcriptional regulator [Pelagibacterium lentulum]